MHFAKPRDVAILTQHSAEPPPVISDPSPFAEVIEKLQKSEREARRGLAVLDEIIRSLPVGVTIQGEDGRFLFVNEAATIHLGGLPDALLNGPLIEATARSAQLPRNGEDSEPDAPSIEEERRSMPTGDRVFLVSRRQITLRDDALLISASVDITERKRAEEELSRRAYFDELTGLPNRCLIQQRLERILAEPDRQFALAFLDIDNFKHINDYYSHAVGDALLVKIAQRVVGHIRPSDMLARISGDEFLLLIEPLGCEDELPNLINDVLDRLKAPFFIEGFEIFTSASIGVSIFPEHGRDYETLRRNADSAMYQVKTGTKGGAAIFDRKIGQSMNERMQLEQRLRLAVRDGQFCCAFQPKVDIHTQEVVGAEALIRLVDEDGLIQAPGTFIGLAIELGLIDQLTRLALNHIMRSIDEINEAFGPQATLSINVAAKQASDVDFMRSFARALQETGCPGRFMIEVTEDAFVAKSRFQSLVLPLLRETGVRVSIDDFGTGYSSLSALADITADEIKIDRSFITDIHLRARSQSVLRAIESLGDALGMTVIAEGVETAEELDYLRSVTRIRFAQGYYFARPLLLEGLAPLRRPSTFDVRREAGARGSSGMRRMTARSA